MGKATSLSAPAKPLSQIDGIKKQLQDLRSRMSDAKRQHESNLARARELRDLLNKAERTAMASDYEVLANDEAVLMARLSRLEAEASYEFTKNQIPVGSR